MSMQNSQTQQVSTSYPQESQQYQKIQQNSYIQQVPQNNHNDSSNSLQNAKTIQGQPIQYPVIQTQQQQQPQYPGDMQYQQQYQQVRQDIYCIEPNQQKQQDFMLQPVDPTKYQNHVQVYTDNKDNQNYYIQQQKPLYLPIEPTQRQSQILNCPYCKTTVKSNVEYKISTSSHVLAAALLFTTGILAPLPYFIDRTKDAVHKCPRCLAEMGTVQF